MQRICLKMATIIINFVLLTQLGCMAPKITFEKMVHDFGELGQDTNRTVEFKFTNTGGGFLKIDNIDTCCGITAESNKKLYWPGESGTVKIDYRPRKSVGLEMKSLQVYSNDKENPKIELTLKAKIVEKIAWEPKSFRLISKGENTICPKITIKSLDNQPFSITSFKSSLNCITADIDPSVNSTEIVLEPKIIAENVQENMRGYIHISLTHPEFKTVRIPFDVITRFTINPPQVMVLNAEPKVPVKRDIFIINIFGQDFEIESASSQKNFVKLLSQKKVGNSYQLELEITPPDIEGDKQIFTDELYVKIKSGERITIPCQGLYMTKE